MAAANREINRRSRKIFAPRHANFSGTLISAHSENWQTDRQTEHYTTDKARETYIGNMAECARLHIAERDFGRVTKHIKIRLTDQRNPHVCQSLCSQCVLRYVVAIVCGFEENRFSCTVNIQRLYFVGGFRASCVLASLSRNKYIILIRFHSILSIGSSFIIRVGLRSESRNYLLPSSKISSFLLRLSVNFAKKFLLIFVGFNLIVSNTTVRYRILWFYLEL